jgi:hypothetical protein
MKCSPTTHQKSSTGTSALTQPCPDSPKPGFSVTRILPSIPAHTPLPAPRPASSSSFLTLQDTWGATSMSIGDGPTVVFTSSPSTSAGLVAQHSTPKGHEAQSTVGQATSTRFPISNGLYVLLTRRIPNCPCSSWCVARHIFTSSGFGVFIYIIRGWFGLQGGALVLSFATRLNTMNSDVPLFGIIASSPCLRLTKPRRITRRLGGFARGIFPNLNIPTSVQNKVLCFLP